MDKLLSDTEKLGFFESNLNQFEFITNDTFTIEDHYWETIEENKEKKTSYEFTEKDFKDGMLFPQNIRVIKNYEDTYFAEIYKTLSKVYNLGRMRLSKIKPEMNLCWHREPDERIHIPVITNPGAHLIIGDEIKHLRADGSIWYCDTRQYHTAFNGGQTDRIHLAITCYDKITKNK